MEHATAPPDASAKETLHYLTVQDLLWINLQVTKRTNKFDFAKLEEASYYQYGYGRSLDILKQAGRFLAGFSKKRPFESGNVETAFVACLSFLLMNGYTLRLPPAEALSWMSRVTSGAINAEEAIPSLAEEHHDHHTAVLPNVQETVQEVLRTYSELPRGA
ncbi:MAG TPA: hypothetical protein VEX38_05180 [Fimbriimonadaceae bacterium]|nr:hypothetical protein [Fimbriimonadaceae bacterium]